MINQQLLTSPHRHDGSSVRTKMLWVCVSLIPGIACYTWFFGPGIIIQCILAIVFALLVESVLLKIRKQKLSVFLQDGSVYVTAILFALMISPFTPWWINFIGICFGLVFAKHLYGGLGNNIFNPAATAYVFILLCFPVAMNQWPSAIDSPTQESSIKNSFNYIFLIPDDSDSGNNFDSTSGATPLADMQNRLEAMEMVNEIQTSSQYGNYAGKGWEWVSMFYLLGGIGLIALGVISWHIPVAILGSVFAFSLIFNMYDTNLYPSSLFHILSGGCMLAAFFVATDPVTASATPIGKLIYGTIIGGLIYAIRSWGAYPDGVAFAIIIANGLVPMIDEYTRPYIIGEN